MRRPSIGVLGASDGDEFRHDRAGAGSELEAVQREAELVKKSLMLGTRAEDGQVVRRPRLDPGPGPDDGRVAHHREKLPHGAGALLELAPVQHGLVGVLVGRREMSAADQHGAIARTA